jgi:hypothetical protein
MHTPRRLKGSWISSRRKRRLESHCRRVIRKETLRDETRSDFAALAQSKIATPRSPDS